MNFLAHIYLSGENELIKIGNFMADGIHGKKLDHFPEEITKGILLHRAIDSFTDAHPIFRQSTKRLHKNYHHYSGIIVDIFYDHFLAKNWNHYSDEKLEDYVDQFYQSLYKNQKHLTEKTIKIMPYMIEQNWLANYKHVNGIERILSQMDNRIKNDSNMRYSIKELQEFNSKFEEEFTSFFKELQNFSNQTLLSI